MNAAARGICALQTSDEISRYSAICASYFTLYSGTFPFSINAHYKEQPRDKQPELKIDIILEA